MLRRNTAHPGGNVQPRGGYRGGSYRERGEQIMWRTGNNSREYQRPSVPSQNQTSPRRDLNTMDVMNIEWDYSYYQPWSDNEWLVDEMIAMQEEALMAQNEDIAMQ